MAARYYRMVKTVEPNQRSVCLQMHLAANAIMFAGGLFNWPMNWVSLGIFIRQWADDRRPTGW